MLNKFNLSLAVTMIWMILIFMLSDQPSQQSNDLSKGVTGMITSVTEKLMPTDEWGNSRLNHLVRKNAHFFAYLVLGMLVMLVMSRSRLSGYKALVLAIIICMLYAISDEVHQLYVPGRGAQLRDVLIDSAGAAVGVHLYALIMKLMKR